MTKIFNFALKIKGGGREGGTCEVLRPCHLPPKKFGTCTSAHSFEVLRTLGIHAGVTRFPSFSKRLLVVDDEQFSKFQTNHSIKWRLHFSRSQFL